MSHNTFAVSRIPDVRKSLAVVYESESLAYSEYSFVSVYVQCLTVFHGRCVDERDLLKFRFHVSQVHVAISLVLRPLLSTHRAS